MSNALRSPTDTPFIDYANHAAKTYVWCHEFRRAATALQRYPSQRKRMTLCANHAEAIAKLLAKAQREWTQWHPIKAQDLGLDPTLLHKLNEELIQQRKEVAD